MIYLYIYEYIYIYIKSDARVACHLAAVARITNQNRAGCHLVAIFSIIVARNSEAMKLVSADPR